MSELFQLNAQETAYIQPKQRNSFLDALNNGWRTALFMESLRNLNWSKDYLWYCELDGVPSPFQRGGVLGLPATSLSFQYCGARAYEFDGGMMKLSVPKGDIDYETVNLHVMDDEQGTLRQFFERWYNQIYNPYTGVLPVTEACKCLSIYFQKPTRRNVRRVYYDIDKSIASQAMSSIFSKGTDLRRPKQTDAIDLYVFPEATFRLSLQNTGTGNPYSFEVVLRVADFSNADYGSPVTNEGVTDIWGKQIGNLTQGNSWLDKIADYI